MTIKGFELVIANLDSISKVAVPRATVQAVNRIASRVMGRSASDVSKKTRVKRNLIKQRARLKRATLRKPTAAIIINRGNLPAIKLGSISMRLSRRKRDKGMQGSVLKVGNFSFPGAFVKQLNNGRWHVLRRTTRAQYPIEVVKIPLATPLTEAFKTQSKKLMDTDLPKELTSALKNQLKQVLKR